MVDGEKPAVDFGDEGKHAGRNDLLFVEKTMWIDEQVILAKACILYSIECYAGACRKPPAANDSNQRTRKDSYGVKSILIETRFNFS